MNRGLTAAAALLAPALLVGAASCIPDLVFPDAPAASSAPPFCGDGIIDNDRGEECDPGNDAGSPTCTRDCKITQCKGNVAPDTKHCYWAAAPDVRRAEVAIATCRLANGHVVTYGSEAERIEVAKLGVAHWVGLGYDRDIDAYRSAQPDEPGWAGARCAGCFGKSATPNEVLFPKLDASPDTYACVVATGDKDRSWIQVPCELDPNVTNKPSVICEREPQGTGARACDGGTCVQVHATRKKYLYVSTPVAQDEAAMRCKDLKMSLVMFDTNEEREQLVRALLPQVQGRDHDAGGTLVFWIGLTRGLVTFDGGSPNAFFWEDGQSLAGGKRPTPWGNNEPLGAGPVRAFVVAGGGAYDTQLSHVDSASTPRPFVCEAR